jgi:hypothetical protein
VGCNYLPVDQLPNGPEVSGLLRSTALRGFGPDSEDAEGVPWGQKRNRITISPADCPIPAVMLLGLSLVGLPVSGPGEKVAWWVRFTFDNHRYELANQKFGLRLRLTSEGVESSVAEKLLRQTCGKLLAAMRVVERAIDGASKALLNAGDATVINQHNRLQKAYVYFRERAQTPELVEDVVEHFGDPSLGFSGTSFTRGRAVMDLNATHDMVAAVTAYFSRLEHDLVLALPFVGFDAAEEQLSAFIGSRWGQKFTRVLGSAGESKIHRDRLSEVVERWRNPYAHGGFEKGHGSTVYVHVPGAGAMPIGLSSIRASPHFSLGNAGELTIRDVFAYFDEFDSWFAATLPHAQRWIESQLDVRLDRAFCDAVNDVTDEEFGHLLAPAEYRQDMIVNMDY